MLLNENLQETYSEIVHNFSILHAKKFQFKKKIMHCALKGEKREKI